MSEVINFPNEELEKEEKHDVKHDIAKENEQYLSGLRAKMEAEYNAIVRTKNENAIELGSVISEIMNSIIDIISTKYAKSPELYSKLPASRFLYHCMEAINSMMVGGIISPLTGDEEEWIDTTVSDDIGQQFKVQFRGKEYSITIQSVQTNIRYPRIYRLNGDNNLAHRIDYLQFHAIGHPEHTHLTSDSIRFITFPYQMESIHSQVVLNDKNEITDYFDLSYDEIKDGIVYPNQTSDDPHAYLIAPKVPVSMLIEDGINIDEEIENYLHSIDDMDSFNFDFNDDEDEDE